MIVVMRIVAIGPCQSKSCRRPIVRDVLSCVARSRLLQVAAMRRCGGMLVTTPLCMRLPAVSCGHRSCADAPHRGMRIRSAGADKSDLVAPSTSTSTSTSTPGAGWTGRGCQVSTRPSCMPLAARQPDLCGEVSLVTLQAWASIVRPLILTLYSVLVMNATPKSVTAPSKDCDLLSC